jgi:hypothetical protein
MPNDSVPLPHSGPHLPPSAEATRALHIEARWEKPLVAATGGEATLLVRVIAGPDGQTEGSRAAPLDVAFVLDRSGSMRGGKLDLARACYAHCVTTLMVTKHST